MKFVMSSQFLPGITSTDPFFICEFQTSESKTQPLLFQHPLEIITAQTLAEVRPALRRIQAATASGLYAAGYLAYEAAPAFDPAFVVQPSALPLLWFALFAEPVSLTPALLEAYTGRPFNISEWVSLTGREAYNQNVAAIREAIARGDTYQVNYTIRLRAKFEGDDFSFYRRLCAAQRANYSAYLNTGRYRILSASPELFFHREGNTIVTRPMKGTAPRGRWTGEDDERTARLAGSEKDRAENVMIVDLLRNDLGRIALTGSVHVPHLFEIERYRTVFQLTSTVAAQLPAGASLEDIFAAVFPGGSVTGAPKVETLKLIAALEDAPRGVYCGALGFAAPGDRAIFNLPIRTVVIDAETRMAEYGVGGGITWDSTPEGEYAENMTKAALLTADFPHFELLETLLFKEGHYHLLDRHLQRLESSAAYFDIPLNLEEVRAALQSRATRSGQLAQQSQQWRVRLLVSDAGKISIEAAPLQPLPPGPVFTPFTIVRGQATGHPLHSASGAGGRAGAEENPPPEPVPVALANTPISQNDIFLYHKTTQRAVYTERRKAHSSVYDVLLWNENEELTEFTTGNLVVELEEQKWTPPQSCGLLAGTFRAELLEQGEIKERILNPADLERASRIWLINSVRGWVQVMCSPCD